MFHLSLTTNTPQLCHWTSFARIMSPPGWPYLVPRLWILSTCWYRNSSQNLVPVLVSAINFALLYLAGSSTFLFERIINISNVTYTKTGISSFSLVIPFASKYILLMLRKSYWFSLLCIYLTYFQFFIFVFNYNAHVEKCQ